MNYKNLIAGSLLIGTLFTGCQDELPGPDAKELYTRAFIKQFGVMAEGHTYNMAQQSTVTVNTSKPSDIKVYATVDGKRYLFADYRQVTGINEIPMNLPPTVKNLLVKVNNVAYTVPLNATLDADNDTPDVQSDESMPELIFGPHGDDIMAVTAPAQVFDKSYFEEILEALPEDVDNINKANVHDNFNIKAEAGDIFTFYPIYWNTSSSHVLGVYWLDDEGTLSYYEIDNNGTPDATLTYTLGQNMQDLYYTRSGRIEVTNDYTVDEPEFHSVGSQQAVIGTKKDETTGKDIIEGNPAVRAEGISLAFNRSINIGFYIKVKGTTTTLTGYRDPETWNTPWHTNTETENIPYSHVMFSQEIRNQDFGRIACITKDGNKTFYARSEVKDILNSGEIASYEADGQTIYSYSSELNYAFNKYTWHYHSMGAGAKAHPGNYARAAITTVPHKDPKTGKTTNRTFFAFEDWAYDSIDLNDLIFVVKKTNVEVFDNTTKVETSDDGESNDDPTPDDDNAYEWVVAAEDLGANDFDFNDLVFSVTAVATKDGSDQPMTRLTVKPLAVGGTLPIYLMYDGQIAEGDITGDGTFAIGGECHFWLKEGAHFSGPLNVGAKVQHTCSAPITFTVPGQYTLSAHQNHSQWSTVNNAATLGGFWLLVDPDRQFSGAPYGKISAHSSLQLTDTQRTVTAPDHSKDLFAAPQMVCLEQGWEWPVENMPVNEAYYNWNEWLKNPTIKWYGSESHRDGSRVTRR